MCSFHFAQQPQVGLLNTATLGLPVRRLALLAADDRDADPGNQDHG